MYLVSLALLAEQGEPYPISVPRLAEELDIQTVSANQMVRKLADAGLVEYTPYKGVALTDAGEQIVILILRNRRLWEVFFVEKLGFSAARADELACRMEHITEEEVADRLSSYLGHPSASPTGKAIPAAHQSDALLKGLPLSSLQPGKQGTILEIRANADTSAYLQAEGLSPGTVVSVLAAGGSGTMLIGIANKTISLSARVAEKIILTLKETPKQHAA